MFVKMNATRHTKIGTLRAGVIYSGEQLGEKGRAVVEALLKLEKPKKNPALVKLTKKQAEAEKAAVVSLVPKGAAEYATAADKAEADKAAAK